MSTASWSEGYATGAGYSYGYYQDLNPRFAAFVLLLEGLDGPPPGPCCELGFGQGLSLALHAAGDPARRWWGNDFMPEHAAHARDLVEAAGIDAVISDESFEDFLARTDLPRFAFIALHGVWSWVSAANRARITRFLHRQLLPGGVVYISYNTLAGWALLLPLRELMRQHLTHSSPAGRSEVRKAKDALDFMQRVLATDPQLVVDTPPLRQRVNEWAAQSPQYLLHELLNEDWHPMSFAQVAAELEATKLGYACSSDLHDRRVDLHLSKPQQALLAEIEDPRLREATKDNLTGHRFRRELWVRGARPLARAEAARRMRAQRLVLAVPRAEVAHLTVAGAHGSTALSPDHLALILGELEDADAPVEMGRILQLAAARGIDANAIVEIVTSLVGVSAVLLVATEDEVEAARPAAQRLNAALTAPHARRAELLHLLSPLSGGGVPAQALLQMLLAARAAAPQRPDDWPGLVWDAMQAEGQKLMKSNKPVTNRADAVAALRPMLTALQAKSLPLLRRLGVTD